MSYSVPVDWAPVPPVIAASDVAALAAIGAVELLGAGSDRQWRLSAAAVLRSGPAAPVGAAYRTAAPQRYVFQADGAGEGIRDTTFGTVVQIPAATVAVQFAIRNYAAIPTELNMAFAPSAAIGNAVEPINAAGAVDTNLFQPVTVNGSAVLRLPAAPVRADAARPPAVIVSDVQFLPFQAPSRSDGGQGRLLFVRQYSAKGPNPTDQLDVPSHAPRLPYYGTDPAAITPNLGGGWQYQGNAAGPAFAVVRAAPRFHYNAGVVAGNFVIPTVAARCGTILITGDSVVSGYGTMGGDTTIASELARMVMHHQRGLLVSTWNEARQGDISLHYMARAADALAYVKPRLTLIQAYSRNDPASDSKPQAYLQFQRAIVLANRALDAGSAVMLLTSSPFGSIDGQSRYDEIRHYADALVRESGLPMLDLGELWGVPGAAPSAFKPGYSVDAGHPTDRAVAVAAAAALPYAMAVFTALS